MATQRQIEATYDYMDEPFRLALGNHADCSCALYDCDFSKTLEQAQRAKHDYIIASLRIGPGSRVLDIGCGWGPMLRAVQERGGVGTGITLSSKQAAACKRDSLEVYIADWKDIGPGTFGGFDAIVSLGSFEHYCSKEEFLSGQQETIYGRFFLLCHTLLPVGGRMYLQTMLWGRNAPKPEQISLKAPKLSSEHIVAIAEKFYPGSWLPSGTDQILRCAAPWFKTVSIKNGRLDYIETMTQWSRRTWQPSWRKVLVAMKMLRYFFLDEHFYFKLQLLINSYNRECFRREIMDHQRIVFEKM